MLLFLFQPSDDEYCPLCDYVYTDDGYFQYTLINSYDRSVDLGIDVTTYYVNMTSQKWIDGKQVILDFVLKTKSVITLFRS